MAIEYESLTPERLDDLASVLLPVWDRRWDPDFTDRMFRWRFLERPRWDAVLAYDNGRPIGFMDSFLRLYRTRTGKTVIREPADWYCHPDYRPVVSLKLIRGFMRADEPILAVGGRDVTVGVLPRLGFRRLPEVRSWVLPVGGGAAVKKLSKTFGFPLSAVPRLLAGPLSVRVHRGWRQAGDLPRLSVVRIEDGHQIPEIPGDDTGYGLSPLLSREEFHWMQRAPSALGEFVWLGFEGEDGVKGLSVSRVYGEGPFRAAHLLHIASDPASTSVYSAILRHTAERLMSSGPQWISARSSCTLACEALQAAGFTETAPCTAYWWHRDAQPEPPIHLGWTTADEGLLPYPT